MFHLIHSFLLFALIANNAVKSTDLESDFSHIDDYLNINKFKPKKRIVRLPKPTLNLVTIFKTYIHVIYKYRKAHVKTSFTLLFYHTLLNRMYFYENLY